MCGIAGFYSHKWNEAQLRTMTDCLQHRGPDAGGYWSDAAAGIGLGHRRLSIIDLSEGANQPMTSSDGRYIIVFNGEVYNFQEVREELLRVEPTLLLKTHSDTEVMLESFRLWGTEAVNKWNGMFAAVIWDRKEQQLYLFRDRLGKKPVYYFWNGTDFAFGSELKALLRLPGISRDTDPQAIYAYLQLGYIPGPMSIYKSIRKMDAGSYIICRKGHLQQTAYWHPADTVTASVLTDEQEALQRLDTLLHSSVAYRMISDVPFGTFLSGGIDSSLVTALAQRNSSVPVNTFSIGFSDSKFDESKYAAAIASHLGTNHHTFHVTEQDALALVPRIIQAYDEPYADSSAIPTMLVSKLARQHVTMTLSGDGGDEAFHGYGMYQWAERLSKKHIWHTRHLIAAVLSTGDNRRKRAANVFKVPSAAQLQTHIFSQDQNLFSGNELSSLLKQPQPIDITGLYRGAKGRRLSPAENQALFDLQLYLKDDLLVKVDRASMQFSLETRSPLLDYRIIEFALNLHPSLKMKGGVQKYLLKEVLYKYVPREFFDRPKWGFAVPLIKWLNTGLSYLIDDYLNETVINRYGWVDAGQVQQLIKAYRGGADYLYNRLWVLIMLHQWAEETSQP